MAIPSTPVPGAYISLAYGVRRARYAAGYHTGRDYAARTGTAVLAVRNGTVVRNGYSSSYGNWVTLRADNGRDYVYCHLSRVTKTGKVQAGQKIGEVGATGNVTGPHLHLEDRPRGGGYGHVRNPDWGYVAPKPKPAPKPAAKPLKNFKLSAFRGAVKVLGYNLGYPSHVAVVQAALQQLGYDIEPTGIKGDGTRTALSKFLARWDWPKVTGQTVTFRQLDRLIWEAEKRKAGTQYPPRAER